MDGGGEGYGRFKRMKKLLDSHTYSLVRNAERHSINMFVKKLLAPQFTPLFCPFLEFFWTFYLPRCMCGFSWATLFYLPFFTHFLSCVFFNSSSSGWSEPVAKRTVQILAEKSDNGAVQPSRRGLAFGLLYDPWCNGVHQYRVSSR